MNRQDADDIAMIEATPSAPLASRRGLPRPRWWSGVAGDLMAFCGLAVVSLAIGLLLNQASRQPLPLVYQTKEERLHAAVTRLRASESAVPSARQADRPREIGLDEFQAFASGRRGLVIDARLASSYGEGHVPGAINLSRANFDSDYRALNGQLSSRKAEAIAVYCSDADCPDSELVADALGALGFQRLLVYKEGWEEWSQSGLPQEK